MLPVFFKHWREDLEPCIQQKADGRIIIHVADAARQGYHNIRGPSLNLLGGGLEYFFEINNLSNK